jgi:hypothetical protein
VFRKEALVLLSVGVEGACVVVVHGLAIDELFAFLGLGVGLGIELDHVGVI